MDERGNLPALAEVTEILADRTFGTTGHVLADEMLGSDRGGALVSAARRRRKSLLPATCYLQSEDPRVPGPAVGARAVPGAGDGITWWHGPLLVGSEYANHLTDADLALLASPAAAPADIGQMSGAVGRTADASWLRGDPAALLQLLERPACSAPWLGQVCARVRRAAW
jgi:hypothetical protein